MRRELETENASDFVSRPKDTIEVCLGMSGRQAEPNTRRNYRSSRVGHDNNDNLVSFQHETTEQTHFAGGEDEHGHDG